MENMVKETIDTISNEVVNGKRQLNLIKPISKDNSKGNRGSKGVMTVINSQGNGKRITFAKALMEYLGFPESLEIGFTEFSIVVANKLPENGVRFNLRKSGNKAVIYSYQLVKEITDLFGLEFGNRVSITFSEVEYIDDGDYKYAEIKLK